MKTVILTVTVLSSLFFFACSDSEGGDNEENQTNTGTTEEAVNSDNTSNSDGGLKVAYVNIDSLTMNYERIKDANAEAEAMMKAARKELDSLQKRFQNYYQHIQSKYATMYKSEQQAAEQNLAKMQQNLEMKQAEVQRRIQNLEGGLIEKNYKHLYDFMDKYAKKHGYDMVLSKSFGGPVLFGKEKFDVTQDVINGMNAEYRDEMEEIKQTEESLTKSDSTNMP